MLTWQMPHTSRGYRRRKRKQAATRNPKATILSSMRTADTQGIAREGDVFDGCLFYIIEGFYENGKEVPERKKQELEKLVVANGGKIWATLPKGKACYVICSRMNREWASVPASGAKPEVARICVLWLPQSSRPKIAPRR